MENEELLMFTVKTTLKDILSKDMNILTQVNCEKYMTSEEQKEMTELLKKASLIVKKSMIRLIEEGS